MRVLIVHCGTIPVLSYGGIERVIWGLGKELVKLGHHVTYLVEPGSTCDFAPVIFLDKNKSVPSQIKGEYDVVHLSFQPEDIQDLKIPYVITFHGNLNDFAEFDRNTIFISRNHAERFQSNTYIYNGLDWNDYTPPDFSLKRTHFHFLGNAAWRVKNVAGAIDVIKSTGTERLQVLGGYRFNLKMGFRFTLSSRISFAGMVGGEMKFRLMNQSKGLIFPVLWHEPFGLAIIESLYYGCPVFGTTYGSLPELVKSDVGFLSNRSAELTQAVLGASGFSAKRCHEYARDEFNSRKMTAEYVKKYEKAMASEPLNPTPPKLRELQTTKFLDWH